MLCSPHKTRRKSKISICHQTRMVLYPPGRPLQQLCILLTHHNPAVPAPRPPLAPLQFHLLLQLLLLQPHPHAPRLPHTRHTNPHHRLVSVHHPQFALNLLSFLHQIRTNTDLNHQCLARIPQLLSLSSHPLPLLLQSEPQGQVTVSSSHRTRSSSTSILLLIQRQSSPHFSLSAKEVLPVRGAVTIRK